MEIVTPKDINDIVSADLAGPYDLDLEDKQKRYYILIFVEHFSKFISTYALEQKNSKNIAKTVRDHFLTHGSPKTFYTDSEINLKAKAIKDTLDFFQTTKYNSAPAHKTSLREAAVKKVKHTLISMSNRETNWKKLLQLATNQLNNQVDTTTGFSPSTIYFKRSTYILEFPKMNNTGAPYTERDWKIVKQVVSSNNLAAKKREKIYFDRFCHRRNFQIGDKVLVYKERTGRFKFETDWFGPWTVVSKQGNSYMIKDDKGKIKNKMAPTYLRPPTIAAMKERSKKKCLKSKQNQQK